MASVKYWIWLSNHTVSQPDAPRLLLDYFGTPEAIFVADMDAYKKVAHLSAKVMQKLVDKSLVSADKVLADCDRLHYRIMTMHDGDYPERLKQIEDPPAILYVKGRLPRFDEEIAIGMVGSRDPSEYGKGCASRLALEITRRGGLIITGMAQGIDTSAVVGALRAGGPMVSVVAGGMDISYPRYNAKLYEDVAAVGALISEYPPGTKHEGWHFPIRNRIISGLSVGVMAVECGVHSGTMITVRKAMEQNRDVFAVPGNIDAPMSMGANTLIRDGAIPVLSAESVIAEYADLYPTKVRGNEPLDATVVAERLSAPAPVDMSKKSVKKTEPVELEPEDPADLAGKLLQISLDDPDSGLTDDQKGILSALGRKRLLVDDLVEETQTPTRRVLSALTMLQVKGYVEEAQGKRFYSVVELI